MRRHLEVNGVTSIVTQYYQDKQQAKADCRHDQEINRHQLLDVVVEKSAPRFARVAFVDAPCTWRLLLERSVFLVSANHHESVAHPQGIRGARLLD